jgi:hypothetical protein
MTMPGGPIIIIDPLKAFIARFDFNRVTRRLSTLLSVLSAMTGTAAAAFIALPGQWQADFPSWAAQGLAITAVVSAGLVPLATSFKQKPSE